MDDEIDILLIVELACLIRELEMALQCWNLIADLVVSDQAENGGEMDLSITEKS